MTTNATAASPAANPLARFTAALFGLLPISLTMLALRFALAIPFWNSGLTKWDGWFTLSFGAKQLFIDEFKIHWFGQLIPFPYPELMATLSGIGEVTLPVLLVFGLATRYAALGLFVMTVIIEFTVPDAWATFHLPWASMALAIMTFGPGKIALDAVLGLDRTSRPR